MGNSASYVPPEKQSVIYPPFEADQAAQTGKVFAITGCTTGTGLAAAKLFAKKGASRVFLLNRPSPRAEAALAAVQAVATDVCVVTHVDCDLTDFAAVRKAAGIVAAATKDSGLDIMCNNAGVMALKDVATCDGYDIQMQTNHLSHFLLSRELYPALVKAVELRGDARIVNHSSFARNGPPGTKLTTENVYEYLGKNGGNLGGDGSSMICGGARWVRYAYTKLANVAFTLALHDKLGDSGVKAVCAAPGLVATQLQATTARDGGMGSGTWFMRWSQSPEDGAVPLLHCCLSDEPSSGELWEPKGMTGAPVLKDPLEKVCLEADREALWKASEAAVGEWDLDL
mmetsp:Transcript_26248/g.68212  ORF Transcript_26248/g.68212 Transcript_26248/m.68212 type:complete len:342 (+) Transcript_26248:21-1046(+)